MLTYGEDPRLIQSYSKMDLYNETGAAQGCNLGSMLFAVAYNEVLEEVKAFARTLDSEEAEALLAALADDTTLVGEIDTVVHLYLLIQKLAKEKYDLLFHDTKCQGYSPSLAAEELRAALEEAQARIIRKDPTLAPYAFVTSCKEKGISIIEGRHGFRSLGGPIGSDEFKLAYIRQTFDRTKEDWNRFKKMHSISKYKLDVLT